ncbi:MAG: hypothetical protein N3A69_02285 [Leptospiraceae bacterium]|nr:hypothetical protein [Leptospiraceae bacterium]
MSKILVKFLFLAFFLLSLSLRAQEVLPAGRFYVHHPNGVEIYLSPKLDSERIAILPYGARVELNKEPVSEKVEYEKILGYWREVNTKKHHGFLVDSYLSRYPVPSINCEGLQTYMEEVYRKQKVLYNDDKDFRAITTIYQGGNQYTYAKMADKKIHKVLLKNAKLKDGYFIGKACSHPAFRGMPFTPSQSSPNRLEFFIDGMKSQEKLKLEILQSAEGTVIIYTEIQNKERE